MTNICDLQPNVAMAWILKCHDFGWNRKLLVPVHNVTGYDRPTLTHSVSSIQKALAQTLFKAGRLLKSEGTSRRLLPILFIKFFPCDYEKESCERSFTDARWRSWGPRNLSCARRKELDKNSDSRECTSRIWTFLPAAAHPPASLQNSVLSRTWSSQMSHN